MSPWSLNLRHLAAVLQVARLGRIGAAANVVNLSQPAVTQAIARLETQLGLALFDRASDGMRPTVAAALLARRIEAALAHIASPRVTAAQARSLIALADHGGYAAAGAATGLSEPTLHRSVRDLSLALRRTLVERRGQGVALTDHGRRLARAFRLARAELAAGLSELDSLKGRETGAITIGAMPLCRARLLPHAIAAFHAAHPAVRLRVIEGAFHELVEPLRDGEVDLMIGALRTPAPGPDLDQRPLFDDHPAVIARAGHPLALAACAPSAEALAAYNWILPPPGTPLRDRLHTLFDMNGIAPPPVPIDCGSVITIRQLLLSGDFLTLLSPDQLAVELDTGLLVILTPLPPALSRTIGVTVRAGWRPTARQQAFLDQLQASVTHQS